MMRELKYGSIVPVVSFLVAAALSGLLGGTGRLLLARQAGGTTPCTGSATAQSITVAAGSGVKKGVGGWNIVITEQTINVQNSKTASMSVGDMLQIDADDVVGIDDKHKRHPVGQLTLKIPYDPLSHDYARLPQPGSTVNASPSQVTKDRIVAAIK